MNDGKDIEITESNGKTEMKVDYIKDTRYRNHNSIASRKKTPVMRHTFIPTTTKKRRNRQPNHETIIHQRIWRARRNIAAISSRLFRQHGYESVTVFRNNDKGRLCFVTHEGNSICIRKSKNSEALTRISNELDLFETVDGVKQKLKPDKKLKLPIYDTKVLQNIADVLLEHATNDQPPSVDHVNSG